MKIHLRKKDVMELYGISRDTVDRAIAKGELELHKGGYLRPQLVKEWAKKKDFKLVAAEDTKEITLNGEHIVADPKKAIIPRELIEGVLATDVSPELLEKSQTLKELADSLTKIATAQEKNRRALKDMGRIADMVEAKAVFDGVVGALINTIKTLDDQLAPDVARKAKIKMPEARAAMTHTSEFLLSTLRSMLIELDGKVEQFMTSKTAESEGKGTRRSK